MRKLFAIIFMFTTLICGMTALEIIIAAIANEERTEISQVIVSPGACAAFIALAGLALILVIHYSRVITWHFRIYHLDGAIVMRSEDKQDFKGFNSKRRAKSVALKELKDNELDPAQYLILIDSHDH